MFWLYGSDSKNIRPVVESQNPDLKILNSVLRNREAIAALRSKNDLSVAYDVSQDGGDVLYKSLVDAKVSLQKALSKISYYQGDMETLKLCGTVADTADRLYSSIEEIQQEKEGKKKKKRVSE